MPFPAEPQTVAAYLASLAGKLKATTIQRRAAAIAFQHRQNGLAPPTAHPLVADVLAGIAREHGTAPQRKSALTVELLREALVAVDDGTLRGIRNRAILLLGFAAALRRSEIVALNEVNIQRVSRHKSTEVLRAYVRHATKFDEVPLTEILQSRKTEGR